MKLKYIDVDKLSEYPNNVKLHPDEQIEQIKKSILEFGFNDPIAIWRNNEVIEGHGRLRAAKELGIKKVPAIMLADLSDEQRKTYAILHNKLTTDTNFDLAKLEEELEKIHKYNLGDYGFEVDVEFDVSEFYIEDEEKKKKVYCKNCEREFYIDKKGNIIK